MAIISKIRRQSVLLLVVVGLAMVLFILGDILSSNTSFFAQQDNTVGVIDGNEIDFIEFNTQVEQYIAQNFGSQQVNEATRNQVRSQVWNQYVDRYVFEPLYADLGIAVTDDELIDLIRSNSADPTLMRYFSDQQGNIIEQFRDPMTNGLNGPAVIEYLKNGVYSGAPEAQQAKQSWEAFKEGWRTNLKAGKLNTLLRKGMYVTSLEAEQSYIGKETSINLSYVAQLYDAIPDSSVSFDDADLKAYYNEHKSEDKYQQKETTRSIEYVVFDIVPSASDIETTKQTLGELKAAFQQTEDDTLFVTENAETPFNIGYYTPGSFPMGIDTALFAAFEGAVFGPYEENGTFKLAKVIGSKVAPDSVEARHILLRVDNGDTASVRAQADSLKKVIKANNNFAELAMEFSTDPGSAQNGGDLGYFTDGMMVPAFNSACFEGEVGDMPIVTTQFGVHLIEITDQTEDKEKKLVAIVDSKVEPSDKTYEKAFNDANNFYINNGSAELFRENGESFGIRNAPNVRLNDRALGGFENPREIITWAYNNEVGTVSEPFSMSEQYVVALLTEVKEKGVLSFESVRNQIELEVIKEKKAEMLKEKMQGETNLDQLATKLGVQVQQVAGMKFNDFSVRGLGNEPKVQGIAYTLDQGQVSIPIEGNRGVYVVRVDSRVDAATEAMPLLSEKRSIESAMGQRVDFQVQSVLRDKAGIEDNRGKFY